MSARRLRKYEARVVRGVEWLALHGPNYGLDITQAATSAADLDMGSESHDILSLAFKGYVPPWKEDDVFNLVCDKIQANTGYSNGALQKFLTDNGFDLEPLNWIQCHILRMGDDGDWELLTMAWVKALRNEL